MITSIIIKKHMKYLYMESHNTLQHIIELKKITENEGERKGIGWLEELKVALRVTYSRIDAT